MLEFINFVLPFKAVGKASIRSGKGRFFLSKQSRSYMLDVAACAAPHFDNVISDPVSLKIWAVFERPKYMCKVYKKNNQPSFSPTWLRHTAKPDADNIAKSICDGLKTWLDDRLIFKLEVEKNYGRLIKDENGLWHAEPSSTAIQLMIVRDTEQKVQAGRYKAPEWVKHGKI